jgi:FG-GAP repeat
MDATRRPRPRNTRQGTSTIRATHLVSSSALPAATTAARAPGQCDKPIVELPANALSFDNQSVNAGDINGDGFDEPIVGAPGSSLNEDYGSAHS